MLFRRVLWRIFWLGLFLVLGAGAALLRWGGYLLVVSDTLPAKADVLVVLAGSVRGEEARRREAVQLLRQGRGDYVLLSVPEGRYFGEWIPDLAGRFVREKYGSEEGKRMVLCPTGADSTQEEARALWPCVEQYGWHSVVVVTSNYHTRRARRIWHEVLADANPSFTMAVHGVADGDFEANGWWRRRRYAKTFLEEAVKLTWTYVFE